MNVFGFDMYVLYYSLRSKHDAEVMQRVRQQRHSLLTYIVCFNGIATSTRCSMFSITIARCVRVSALYTNIWCFHHFIVVVRRF